MSSRLFLEIREKRSLCYDVHSYVNHYLDTGSTVVNAGVDPSKLDEALRATFEELAKMSDTIPERELTKAKEFIKGRLQLRMEDTRAVASWLGGQELLRREILTVDEVLAIVDSIEIGDLQRVAETLLRPWASYSPAVRREVLEAVFARPERLPVLLSALEQKHVLPGQLEPFRVEQLRKHRDPRVRRQAQRLLAAGVTPDRQRVVADYQSALQLAGDAGRGKAVFKRACSACHQLEGVGTQVGPDLTAARNQGSEAILLNILDPNREVKPQYLSYVLETTSGRTLTGMIAAETANSLTLRRADGTTQTVLRVDIEELRSTGVSFMPEGLEKQVDVPAMADLLAYLNAVK
jgi:putative heme-binding domain-containing protein